MSFVFTTLYTDALNGADTLITNDGIIKNINVAGINQAPLQVKNSYCTPSDPSHLFGAATLVTQLPTGGQWFEFEIARFILDEHPNGLSDAGLNVYFHTNSDLNIYAGFGIYGGFFNVNQQISVEIHDSTTDVTITPTPQNPNGFYIPTWVQPYTPVIGDKWRVALIGSTYYLFLNGTLITTGSYSADALSGTNGMVLFVADSDNLFNAGLINFKAGTVVMNPTSRPVTEIHTTVAASQVTYAQPPPAGAVSTVIPNESRENLLTVSSSEVDNPGLIPPPVADSFARVADPWTVNPNLTQYFPVNNPPAS